MVAWCKIITRLFHFSLKIDWIIAEKQKWIESENTLIGNQFGIEGISITIILFRFPGSNIRISPVRKERLVDKDKDGLDV